MMHWSSACAGLFSRTVLFCQEKTADGCIRMMRYNQAENKKWSRAFNLLPQAACGSALRVCTGRRTSRVLQRKKLQLMIRHA
jgi:hypothetical protein